MHANATIALIAFLTVGGAWAQDPQPPADVPGTQPATQPTSQPTTTQAVEEQKHEAEIKEEMAEETAREAESKLEEIEVERAKAQREARRPLAKPKAQEKLERLDFEEANAQRQQEIAELQKRYAQERRTAGELREALEGRRAEVAQTLASLDQWTADQRSEKAAELDTAAEQHQARAQELLSAADAEQTQVGLYLKLQDELAEQRSRLEAEPESKQQAELLALLRESLAQTDRLIDKQWNVSYAIRHQARHEQDIAEEYRREAQALRERNRRFWVQHVYLLNIGRILLVAIALTVAINIVAWLITRGAGKLERRVRREAAGPGIKRVRTLVSFARSIVKLLVWIFAIVTILGEFGISPGHSAGALGVIGLVLAGMFQQLVVDFVKGIDIATGGHYFIGDFIEVSGKSGHVLSMGVKYTVLRTPSGQVLSLPNSQCVPSRRFPAGYVDNYVDIPLAAGGDLEQARTVLAEVGRLLNQRVEAVKRRPELVATFHDGATRYIRVRVRVLPTCGWVVADHYIPMVKRRFETENIPLAGEPNFFFINNVPTFRRLFSRQMSESEIEQVVSDESQPTLARPDVPDPDAPPPPDEETGGQDS